MAQAIQTLDADGDFLLNTGSQNVGPDGVQFAFTVTGTNSLVLKKNTAPPGAAVNLVSVAFVDGGLTARAADTAITATGIAYVSAADAALDLYATLNWTSGAVVVRTSAASIGGPDGSVPAADVTPGTFGANTGAAPVGGYSFPTGLTVNGNMSIDGQNTTTGVNPRHNIRSPGGATSLSRTVVAVTGIANNVATLIGTITVPNSAQAAALRITVLGSLGAGGAVGAYEASASNTYTITVVRTAGVNAVAAISSATTAAAAAVAGAATVTAVVTVGSVAGAVGAENTFPVNVTIARSGGSSAAHTCVYAVEVLNAVDSGVTF